MTSSEIITAITIHLLVPAAGVAAYLVLCRRLFIAGASPIFLAQIFLLFVCYGGVLLIVLTSLFWHWSGMASLGCFFLILAAPILLFPVLLSLWKQKSHSFAHRMAFRACAGFYALLAMLLCSAPLMRVQYDPASRTKRTQATARMASLVAGHQEQMPVRHLPSYSPELNPEERLNRSHQSRLDQMLLCQKRPEQVSAFFNSNSTRYAA